MSLSLFLCLLESVSKEGPRKAARTSSVVDGVDGELARFKGTGTPSDSFLDAVLDRYADVAILAGLALWSILLLGAEFTAEYARLFGSHSGRI